MNFRGFTIELYLKKQKCKTSPVLDSKLLKNNDTLDFLLCPQKFFLLLYIVGAQIC